jgi:hypothetical protein
MNDGGRPTADRRKDTMNYSLSLSSSAVGGLFFRSCKVWRNAIVKLLLN